MSTTTKPKIAFFGATGGCTFVVLVHTLRADYPCVALVRTPSKLLSLLEKAGLTKTTLSTLLTIHEGNALNVDDVKKTLLLSTSTATLPSYIITGLGAAPQMVPFSIRHPFQLFTIDQPTLCGTAAQTLLSALSAIYTEHPALAASKSKLAFISTTGISSGPEDVPFLMRFLYHWILAVPHMDKRNMENAYRGEEGQRLLRNVTGVRPTLLMGTADAADGIGAGKIRAGVERSPVLGYTVKRADVGEWIFENLIQSVGEGKWEGEMISLAN